MELGIIVSSTQTLGIVIAFDPAFGVVVYIGQRVNQSSEPAIRGGRRLDPNVSFDAVADSG